MSRLVTVGACVLAGSIAILHGGCRIGYDLIPNGLAGGGAVGGDSTVDPTPQAGVGAGGSEGGGASAGSAGNGATSGTAVQGGQTGEGGVPSSQAGEGGEPTAAGAGGEPSVGSLPPLPCAEPLVWSADFSSDPTALDVNGDAQPDWVIRGGEAFATAELVAGVWRPAVSKALDSYPPVNFSGRTQARVRLRNVSKTADSPTALSGAVFWINLDYTATDFLAVFTSIKTPDGAAYDLGVFANVSNTAEPLSAPLRVPNDVFVLFELDFDPIAGTVTTWVDGTPLPITPPNRSTFLNTDRWATLIAPEAMGEFDDIWVATCTP